MDVINLWMAIVGVGAMTIIFRDNPLFHYIEANTVGALAGTFLVMGTLSLRDIAVTPISQGAYIFIIPIVLASMQFLTFIPRFRWLARYPVAIMGGTGVGLTLRALISTEIINQIVPTINEALLTTGNWFTSVSSIYFLVTMVLTIAYFTFGYDLKGRWKMLNTLARVLILIGLGAEAGSTFAVGLNATSTWYNIMSYLQKGLGIA